jgi:hypothetical protein
VLRVTGYTETGGVSGGVAATAERTNTRLTQPTREAARTAFLRMVHLAVDVPDTRRQLIIDAISETTHDALHAFAQARLVTLDSHCAEITHEALIHSWPRLQAWINEDRQSQASTPRPIYFFRSK